MRRSIPMLALAAATLWSAPASAQSRSQLGPLCTTETTPADQQIEACNKIIALKVFSGDKLATIYFWRAVGWNKKGNYSQVIADATEALRLHPGQIALYNLRGSAYYDKGEYDIAISDFKDALRIGPPSGIIFHNRGNAFRSKGDYAKAIDDYDSAIRLGSKDAFTYQNRGASKQALGDLDGALADINEAIRVNPTLPSPLNNRTVIWRAKGDFDRAIADGTEAIRLARARAPVNIMTPPGSRISSAASPMRRRATPSAPVRILPPHSKASPSMPAARPIRPRQGSASLCCRGPWRLPNPRRQRGWQPLQPPSRRRKQLTPRSSNRWQATPALRW